MTLEEIEKRRADRKAAAAEAKEKQYVVDLEALDKLEEQYGDGAVAIVNAPFFVAGLPTMVIVRCPSDPEYRRFRDMVRKAKNNNEAMGAASDLLTVNCVVYPEASVYSAMKSAFPGLPDTVSIRVVGLAQGKAEEEGKG